MESHASALDRICGTYDDLSEAEQRVADFVLRNQSKTTQLSVREIAELSSTSGATVSRFVRRMGYASFADFRLDLARENPVSARESSLSNFAELSLENVAASVRYILDTKTQELANTAALLDVSTIKRAVKLIEAADVILFGAVGNSMPVCASCAFKFAQIGLRSSCPSTTESMILQSMALRKDDLVIVVSSSGVSQRLRTIIDNAEDNGAPIILVSSNPDSELAKRATLVFCASTRDQALAGSQFSSHMSAHFVMEVLFLFLTANMEFAREHARLERKMLGADKDLTSDR